ncbi:hypothetical protein HHL21_06470 [Massilia sp. RP-1-19]|uniref:Uncharacterized protein n=1 Tax=Massilia polaris TaxID=2728846 RepID=A0A848HI72_9BURK|nr:hypothetical protein [Massilia polaris]NML60732.1 hypothetical protein [Massilia polaris]
MHEKTVARIYTREMCGAMFVYVVLLVASIKLGRPMADGVGRILALASRVIGVLLVVWALARHFRRVDEFIRQTTLESIAIAAAVAAGLSFTYGFLETAGYPRLSMFVVLPLMFGVWGVVSCVRAIANR